MADNGAMTQASQAVPASLTLKGAEIIPAGREWRANLPLLVAGLVDGWSLHIEAPFPGLSYNYVAPVTCADGTRAVLKLWFPDAQRGFERESEALRLYDGAGSVRLLKIDVARRAMLIEYAGQGANLWHLPDEDQRIEIAAKVMKRLWRAPSTGLSLPAAAAEINLMVEKAPGLAPPHFPLHWIASAKAMFTDLEASHTPVLLHGDLHHTNVLTAEREAWLAIDPHGLVGPPVYEPIQFILNIVWPQQDRVERLRTIARHVEAFGDALNLEPEAIRMCGTVIAVLQAFWTLEDHGADWEKDIALVEDFAARP
jgi:streptomycin 6-kinase